MPSINFYAKDSVNDEYLIMISFPFLGKSLKLSTGEKIKRRFWNAKKQEAASTWEFNPDELNFRLRKLSDFLFEEYRKQSNDNIDPSADTLRKAYEIFIHRRQPETTELLPYIDQFTERYKTKLHPRVIMYFKQLKQLLIDFEGKTGYKVNFQTISPDFYYQFYDFLTGLNYLDNTIGGFIKKLKRILNQAFEDGVSTCQEHKKKYFVAPNLPVDSIYLTQDEINTIYNKDMGTERQNFKKDLFVLACHTGLRFSDWHKFKNYHYQNEKLLRVITQKSQTEVIIPLHPVAQEILNKYDESNWYIPSNQKMNDFLKVLGEDVGLTQIVNVTERKNRKVISSGIAKYDLISTHTARRSFATNAFLSGVPTLAIMKITGHRTESSFMKYIRISSLENALILQKHSFFTV